MSAKLQKDVLSIRTRIGAAKERIEQLRGSRVSRDEALQALDQYIDESAQLAATPQVSYLVTGERIPYRTGTPTKEDAFSLLCWLEPERVRARLIEDLYAKYGDDSGIDSTTRSEDLKRLEAELFNLEVEEERFILAEEDAGVTISRRGDADPRAILEA